MEMRGAKWRFSAIYFLPVLRNETNVVTLSAEMRHHCHLLLLLLMLLFPLHSMAKRDSLLWVGIQQAGIMLQQHRPVSAYAQCQRLLPLAEAGDDALAEAQLHNLMGFSLREQGNQQQSICHFGRCVETGETHHFLQKATKARHQLYFSIMLPAYAMLTTYYKDQHQTEQGLRYARKGMQWAEQCPDAVLRMSSESAFAEVLIAHHDKMLAADSTKQDVRLPETQVGTSLPHVGDSAKSAPKQPSAKPAIPATRIEYVQVDRSRRIALVVVISAALLLLALICIAIGHYRWRKRERQTIQEVRESYLEGMEQERSRLARELHDGVSNQLLAVEMKLGSEGLTEQTLQLLTESRQQVRRFSHELMPPEFEYTTLDEMLAHYISQLDGIRHCCVTYESRPADADWTAISHHQAYELYRIVQESTSNALKHAQATAISVVITLKIGALDIVISDNGSVSPQKSTGGIGLRTIHQRAETIGAIFRETDSPEGHTFSIHLDM